MISVAASIVAAHPRTLRIYEDEGLVCPPGRRPTSASTATRTSAGSRGSRHLTRERGVNLAGIRLLFELEERLGTRILEALYDEGTRETRRPPPLRIHHGPRSRRSAAAPTRTGRSVTRTSETPYFPIDRRASIITAPTGEL